MKIKIHSLFLLTFFFASCVYSQTAIQGEYNFRNYNAKNGLPSSETYDVQQDNEGNIWIATDRGAVKYNGYEFKTYTKKDGLLDDVVLKIYKDPFNRIWFLTIKEGLCYYEKSKIRHYKYNHIIKKYFNNHIYVDKEIIVSKNKTVYFSQFNSGQISISSTGKVTLSRPAKKTIVIRPVEHKLFISTWCGTIKEYFHPYHILFNRKKKSTEINSTKKPIVTGNDKNAYLLVDNKMVDLSTFKILFSSKVRQISLNKIENSFWLGSLGQGVQELVLNKKRLQHKRTLLKNYSVTNVLKDKNGGYWFSTLEKGIFYLPFIALETYTHKTGLISNEVLSLMGFENKLYIGYLASNYQVLSQNKPNTFSIFSCLMNQPTSTSLGKIKNNIIMSHGGCDTYFKGKKVYDGAVRDFYPQKNSCLGIMEYVTKFYENGTVDTLSYDYSIIHQHKRRNYKAVMQDETSKIWVGDFEGLYYLKNKDILPFYPSKFQYKVTDLIYSKKWGKLIATRDGGVFQLNDTNFTKLKNVISNDVTCLFIDSKEQLWIGTNKGVNLLRKDKSGKISIECISQNHGLRSNEVLCIYVGKQYAWIGTKMGLTKVDLENFQPYKGDHTIRLKSITLNGRVEKNLRKKLEIPHNKDIIKLNFNAINFITKGKYKYRFHTTSKWSYTKIPEITLFNPEDGIYSLEVSFFNENNVWSSSQPITSFEILPPFWRTNYFKLLTLLLIVYLIFLFVRYKKRQFETKQKVLVLEQKALFAQMNPHFIFNTLNSIQSFHLYNELDKAEYFLGKFSKLLRETLHVSRKASVSFKTEIGMLEKYLELEQMRFSSKFKWNIRHDIPEQFLSLRIPSMLIQPYVENAIKHGFTEKRDDYQIGIVLTIINTETLKCEVIDNGIGRTASLQKKEQSDNSKEHISYGEKITKERLKSYNKRKNQVYGSLITDSMDGSVAKGTKVTIIIPILK